VNHHQHAPGAAGEEQGEAEA
ncbi:TPA: RNA chaperone Hfq, partial [Aeromonas hydrophila]|nr:RNA chaperone Hfq [Aeromonas hydrophila]